MVKYTKLMKLSKPKYIFVTGGVASSLGKGIISASIARLLQARGYSVTIQKLDPYINIDPGTLNPYEHGECYVTEDGTETDLDLGHYERFTSIQTTKNNNVTTGKIYQCVIDKERSGEFLGKTVQVIPHITDEIKRRIQLLGTSKQYDVIITEIGGTVGDIESLPFIESVRQLRYQLGYQNTVLVHLTLIPYMAASGELKTKPTQHSVKELLSYGLQPDVLVLRSEHDLSADIRRKVALFRMIMGLEEPTSGSFRVGPTVKLAYVDQQHKSIDPEKTVYEVISQNSDLIQLGNRQVPARAYVGRFNFNGADQEKKCGVLSGGERNRLHLALALKEQGNVLLLDEPTNDIDVNTLRALEEGLENFAGCAVVISHDRWFLDRIATHILSFEGDSKVVFYEGSYSEYEAWKKAQGEDTTPKRVKYKKLLAEQ